MAKKKAKKTRKTSNSATAISMPDNIRIERASNGFVIESWDPKNDKTMRSVAKNKAELNRALSKFIGVK